MRTIYQLSMLCSISNNEKGYCYKQKYDEIFFKKSKFYSLQLFGGEIYNSECM